MQKKEIINAVNIQKIFFATGKTKNIDFRIKQLKKLRKIIIDNEKEISEAVSKDLGRSDLDNYMCEIFPVVNSIDFTLKNLKKWVKPQKVQSPMGAKSFIYPEPYGQILILSPWN